MFTALLGDRSSRRTVLSASATAILLLLTLVSAAGAELADVLTLAACTRLRA